MIRSTLRPLLLVLAAAVFGSVSAAEPPPNMTTYYLGVLVKGPKYSAEVSPERAEIQKGHMAHLDAMWKAGNGDWRGVLIYRTKTLEEAQRLADDDPAVKAGRLMVTTHPRMVQKDILPDPLEGTPKTEAK